MIPRIWSGASPCYLLLLPFSWLYGLITAIIRYSYRYGWRRVYRFPLPVVVVGNLSVGGNGKTPVVLWLVEQLQRRDWHVGVVSRGYGGRSRHYPIIVDDHTYSGECGDEPLLIWQRTGVPVAVSPQRADAVAALLRSHPTIDIVVTDDGLQHYALNRDIEWVVIDGDRRFGNGWLLPAGPMREHLSKLNVVQGVIVNGGEAKLGEVQMQLRPGMAVNLLSNERRELSFFRGVVAMAGIAYPIRFFSTLRSHGITIMKEVEFSDHQVYHEKMLASLTSSNEILLMTEKDAVKCRYFAHTNWWYLPVEAVLPDKEGKGLLESVEKSIYSYREANKTIW